MNDISEFTNLYQEENEKLFEQGIWLAKRCVDKKTEAEIKLACGLECGASADTINKRLRVGRVFGDQYFVDCNWSLHVKACELAHANGKDTDATKAAFSFMDTAIKGYPDPKTGVIRPHSAATLEAIVNAAAKPASGKQKPETVYKGTCIIGDVMSYEAIEGVYTTIELSVDGVTDIVEGQAYTLTITRTPQPETAPSVGGNGAAA